MDDGIRTCPKCQIKVFPLGDGFCPSCHEFNFNSSPADKQTVADARAAAAAILLRQVRSAAGLHWRTLWWLVSAIALIVARAYFGHYGTAIRGDPPPDKALVVRVFNLAALTASGFTWHSASALAGAIQLASGRTRTPNVLQVLKESMAFFEEHHVPVGRFGPRMDEIEPPAENHAAEQMRHAMLALESIFPMRRRWDPAVDDASKVPVDAVSIRLVSGAKNIDKLPSYTKLESLWGFDIDARALDAICNCAALESLYLDNIKTGDLSPLERLTGLRVLGLERCSKLTSLDDVGELESLQGLGITHFKNVHDLGPLARLKTLRALAVAGSIWTTMRVASFQPLQELHELEFLHLTNIKPDDQSLKPLARLTKLKTLEIANFYRAADFAWLARSLPATECQWFRPYVEVSNLQCKKCGATSMIMLTGKGKALICKECDRPKLEKQIREWDTASAS